MGFSLIYLDINKPLEDFFNTFFSITDVPDHQIERPLWEEILVGGVVFSLTTKIPGSEQSEIITLSQSLLDLCQVLNL